MYNIHIYIYTYMYIYIYVYTSYVFLCTTYIQAPVAACRSVLVRTLSLLQELGGPGSALFRPPQRGLGDWAKARGIRSPDGDPLEVWAILVHVFGVQVWTK